MKDFFYFLNRVFDIFAFGSNFASRYLFIVVMSILSAVIFLILFKITSNQSKLRHQKDKIFGNILQMRLYKDKFCLLVQCILNILKHNVLYLKHTLLPFLVICIPLIIITVQINIRGGYEPLKMNDDFIIQVDLDDRVIGDTHQQLLAKLYCTTSPEIMIQTLPLRIANQGKLFWRANVAALPKSDPPYIRIGIQGSDSMAEKKVMIDSAQRPFVPLKTRWSLWHGLFNNAEGFIQGAGPLKSISINYRRATYPFLFWRFDAIVLYFILTMVFGFALKKLFGVVI